MILFQLLGYNKQNYFETFCFTNAIGVIHNGIEYTPISCKLTGLRYSSEGEQSTPILNVSDIDSSISSIVNRYENIDGSTIYFRIVLKRF